MIPRTEIGKSMLEHKKEIIKGFKDSFEFILELEKHPEKLEKLPDRGKLIRKGRRFIIKSKDKLTFL